ncbi:ABC transporter permease [Clostridium sp. 19966]|uniref:ABC transporter permease n=1 Tax=Clostridium sp. 19966 TaxID=2768166 RepID=UPI0028E032D2|nr:ABC transporter permease [Clostridium sp. 19966]MDT8715999.1 ABC transporter permease [Clostridium sp. 19966]
MSEIRVIYSTFKLHLSQSFSRATFKFCIIVQPIIFTFIMCMMYKDSKHANYANYVILGSGLSTLWSAICFSSAGDIERERYMGTLETLFCCPSKFTSIIIGKVLANTFLGLSGIVISIAFTKVFFNQNLYIKHVFLFVLSFILMILSFISISMLISPVFTLSKNARALMNCMEFPMYILCGFVFPIDMLPSFIRPISYILSPSWSTEILKESSLGISDLHNFYMKIAVLCIICMIYAVISRALFKCIDRKTRIDASLGVS